VVEGVIILFVRIHLLGYIYVEDERARACFVDKLLDFFSLACVNVLVFHFGSRFVGPLIR
jgi:hypothetical protein